MNVAWSAQPAAARRAPVALPTADQGRPPWAAARAAGEPALLAQTAVAEPAPAARTVVAEPAEPDTPTDTAPTRWSAVPVDTRRPPWSADTGAEPVHRPTVIRSAWTVGPGLARTALIGLVCLAAVIGCARGLTMGTMVHLTVDATRPTLSEYRQLRAGLSYEQVDAVFGDRLGLDESSADAQVRRTFGNGARLDLRFSGGVLQGFAEHGLGEGPSLRVFRTAGAGALLFSLAGGLAGATAWWLLLYLVASWRGCRLAAGRLAVLAAAGLAVGLVAALALPVLLGYAIAFAVFLGLLVGWTRRDVAEAFIIAAVAVAGGSLAVWLPTLLGLQLSALLAR